MNVTHSRVKDEMKNFDLFSKKIETTTPIPFERAWSREFKNALLFVSIAPYAEISESEGAKKGPFCMGIFRRERIY